MLGGRSIGRVHAYFGLNILVLEQRGVSLRVKRPPRGIVYGQNAYWWCWTPGHGLYSAWYAGYEAEEMCFSVSRE